MDLNDLYQRHQVALMRADAAPCEPSREEHLEDARAVATRIEHERDRHDGQGPAPLAG